MRKHTLWSLCLLMLPAIVVADTPAPNVNQRLERLERMVQNQNVSDLLLQVQRLQREVQQLRGEQELQNHALEALKRQQRELYLDLDRRITAAEPAAPPPAAAEVAAAAPPPPATVKAAAPPPSITPDSTKEQPAYQAAFNLLKQGSYPESIGAFRAFLQAYPSGDYADNAQYWLGEASYVTREFDTALNEFNKVLEDHPDSGKVPGAMLKIGYIYYEQRQWDNAKKILERLFKQHPRTTEARLAEQRLQRLRQEGH
jgi:tol-pal system protein YbgF